jgi:hypothetical protein
MRHGKSRSAANFGESSARDGHRGWEGICRGLSAWAKTSSKSTICDENCAQLPLGLSRRLCSMLSSSAASVSALAHCLGGGGVPASKTSVMLFAKTLSVAAVRLRPEFELASRRKATTSVFTYLADNRKNGCGRVTPRFATAICRSIVARMTSSLSAISCIYLRLHPIKRHGRSALTAWIGLRRMFTVRLVSCRTCERSRCSGFASCRPKE